MSERLVERAVAGLRRRGARAEGRVRSAVRGTDEEIASAALAYGAELVVIGSGRLPAPAALLGTDASHGDEPTLSGVPGDRARTPEEGQQ